MNKNIRQKFIISAALLVAATASAFAQGNGMAGINGGFQKAECGWRLTAI